MISGRESLDRADLADDFRCEYFADSVDLGQGRATRFDSFTASSPILDHCLVQPAQLGQEVLGDPFPFGLNDSDGTNLGQQRGSGLRREMNGTAASDEVAEVSMEPVDCAPPSLCEFASLVSEET